MKHIIVPSIVAFALFTGCGEVLTAVEDAGCVGDCESDAGCDEVCQASLCDSQLCSGRGTCVVIDAVAICECDTGYESVGLACEDINECGLSSVCDRNATCMNLDGEFACTCNEQFVGDGFECNPEVFTIAVLGDTQGYVDDSNNLVNEDRSQGFINQVQWILDNQVADNIQFVSHVGDIVERDTDTEWARSRLALDLLFSSPDLPWSAAVGNHDLAPGTTDGSKYLQNFGPDRFSNSTWFGGSDKGFRGSGLGLNSFQLIGAQPRQYLHLNVEVNADDQALAWAQEVVDSHLGMPTILSTHEFLNDQRDNSHPESDSQNVSVITSPYMKFTGKNSATRIWNKLIAPNSQIFLTLNGHYCCEREMVQLNNEGFPVLHVQTNYSVSFQSVIVADAGWIRLLEIDEAKQEIRLRTTKPAVPLQNTELENPLPGSVVSYPMTWRGRFGERTLQFQEGVNGYTSTEDLWFSERANEQTPSVNEEFIRTSKFPESTVNQQAIVKFASIVGTGTMQISPGATVVGASLSLTAPTDIPASGGEPNAVHQILVDWSESTAGYNAIPWSGGQSGMLDQDGVEASRVSSSNVALYADNGYNDQELSRITQGQSLHYDVSEIVSDWSQNNENYGFLLQSLGTAGGDGLFLASSDYSGIDTNARPRLSVSLTSASSLEFRQGSNGYASATDTWISSQLPNASQGLNEELHCISESTTEQVLVRFSDIVGSANGQLPSGARVQSARLVLYADRRQFAGSNALHALHAMLVPWQENATFGSSAFGGNGVQIDGLEAEIQAQMLVLGAVADNGQISFDVTQSVQSWADGGTNNGWLLRQLEGDNRLFLQSHQAVEMAFRPRLLVQYTVD